MNKLTLNICHKYYNSDIIWKDFKYTPIEFWETIIGTSLRQMIDECKLILISLESISNEDAIEISKILGFNLNNDLMIINGKWYCKNGLIHKTDTKTRNNKISH